MERENHVQFRPSSPQEHERGTTFIRTCFNGINVLSGVGILSIPYALSEGGWCSFVLLLIAAGLCWYTAILLKRCMDTNPNMKTYPDIGHLAFGNRGRIIVSFFMYLELFLVAVEFLILEGDNLHKLFPDVNIDLAALRIPGNKVFILLAALIVLPTTWMRDLGVLAYVSATGIVASAVLVACVIWVGAVDGVGFHQRGQFLNWPGVPTAVSLYAFCYCAHAVFPTLRNSMEDKNQFPNVLLVCFITSTITYGSMAVIGYLMYGQALHSQVTLNLPLDKLSTKIAIYTTVINPLSKYGLLITPIANAIEGISPKYKKRPVSVFFRSVIVVTTVIIALTFPFFGYVMAFAGALSVTGSMLLPCLCYLKIKRSSRAFGVEMVVIVAILVGACFIGVTGVYTSLRQIVNQF